MAWDGKTWLRAAPALAVLLPAAAHAHPGLHEGDAAGLPHALTQADHLLALLLIGTAALWAPRVIRAAATRFHRRRHAAASVALTTAGRE